MQREQTFRFGRRHVRRSRVEAHGRERTGEGHRAHDVEVAGADGERVALDLLGGVHQDRLDLIGREERVDLEQERGGAGHEADGHRGAGQFDAVAADRVRLHVGQGRARGQRRDDAVARSHEIRLDDLVAVGRTAARVRGDDVVAAVDRVLVVHGADREDVRIVAGGVDREVAVAATVARGGDHGQAGGPGPLHCLGQRVGVVALGDRVAQRHVQHADVEACAVGDGEIDRLDYRAGVAESLVVEHAQVDEVHVRRDAADRTVDARTTDRARDVRAVTKAVEGAELRRIGEVDIGEDALGRNRRARGEARVDQGDRDPLAREAEVLDDRVGAGSGHGHVHRTRHETVGGNGEHPAVGGEIEDLELTESAVDSVPAASTDVPAAAERQVLDVSGGEAIDKRHDHANVLFAAIHLFLEVASNFARCGLGRHGEGRECDPDDELFLHG